jgi:hypothetical protein
MKTLSFVTLLAACGLFTPVALAADPTALKGCDAKKANLKTQIEYARAHNNSHQQAGLQKALDEVNAHCTDASLRQERENKIAKAKHEVSERQADLAEATQKGDADKISKRQAKLAESKKELQDAMSELDK